MKVKVYGTDSTKEVRARLIEILYERVQYHKDKFIAPILHDEMEAMEVKKNGKVEHSDKTHDDQVFSYLMALRVWYDGIDLMERYGLRKNTIKTDEDIDIESLNIEANNYGLQPFDVETASRNDTEVTQNELQDQLEYLKNNKVILGKDFRELQRAQDQECLQSLLSSNPIVRQAYIEQNHIDTSEPAMGGNVDIVGSYTQMPDSIFGGLDDPNEDESVYDDNLAGNLADQWRGIL